MNDPHRPAEIQKQISIFLPLSDWKALRFEAAQRKIPITELCRRWMAPGLRRLRQQAGAQPGRSQPATTGS